jgi:hypothetical protein
MSQTVYLVIKYDNYNQEDIKLQPLNILFVFKDKQTAVKKARDLANEVYGGDISDFDNEKHPKYITQNFWKVKTIAQYSDWSISIKGVMDNVVFAVVQTELPNIL